MIEGALLIAQHEYPKLNPLQYVQILDEMKATANETVNGGVAGGSKLTEVEQVERLREVFHTRWGFRSNSDNYYDPKNSLLNDVLDRRTGIPITLSIVYIEIARAAGLPLCGIGMPGHFIVGFESRDDLFIDVFDRSMLLTREDCAARARIVNPEIDFRPECLARVGTRDILARILNNLMGIYLNAAEFQKALEAVERIVSLKGPEPHWIRQRGLIHARLRNLSRAVADLDNYLVRAPDAQDRRGIEEQLHVLRQLRAMIN